MLPEKIGRYQIKAELGRGGMSTVFLAHDPLFERDVAVKLLPRELLHHRNFRRRFDREAKIVAALDHPAIVPVYDFGEEDEQPFLVMRFMAGGSLSDRLKQGPMSLNEAVRILQQLAPALDEVHRHGVIHRDLKPSNILFDQRNDAYISDFGTAKFTYEHTKLTETGGAVGTPAYMSPEQIQAEVEIDGRSDLYTLGVILFEMLTGQHPYQTNTPIGLAVKHIFEPTPRLQDMQPHLPAACQAVVGKVMAKDRAMRYQTAGAFVADLTAVAESVTEPETGERPFPYPTPLTIGRRLALLIGSHHFEDDFLAQLRTPTADVIRLAELIQDPQTGRFDEVVCLLDEPADDMRRAISRFFADKTADDLLLLYFSGHAALDGNGLLHLLAKDTEHGLLRGTAVSATFIADEMDTCRAQQQIIILDCTFSRSLLATKKTANYLPGIIGKAIDTGASFARNASLPRGALTPAHGQERIILSASDATHYVWQESGLSGQAEASRFTEFLLEGLADGRADQDGDGFVTIGELYDFVAARIELATRNNNHRPRKWFDGEQGHLIIAHNPQQEASFPGPAIRGTAGGNAGPRSATTAPPGRRPSAGQYRVYWLALFLLLGLFIIVSNGGSVGQVAFSSDRLEGAMETAVTTVTAPPPEATLAATRLAPTTIGSAIQHAVPATAVTPQSTPSAMPENIVPIVETAVPSVPPALVRQPASLFAAPSSTAAELAIVGVGDAVAVLGRAEHGNWLYVMDSQYVAGYVYGDRVTWSGDVAALPIIPADGETTPTAVATTAACSSQGCPALTLDLYPLNGRCQGNVRYRTVYIQGHGGDGRYTYYWNGVRLAGPTSEGFGFEVNNSQGARVIGAGKVVSGDGQTVEKSLFIADFPCGN